MKIELYLFMLFSLISYYTPFMCMQVRKQNYSAPYTHNPYSTQQDKKNELYKQASPPFASLHGIENAYNRAIILILMQTTKKIKAIIVWWHAILQPKITKQSVENTNKKLFIKIFL